MSPDPRKPSSPRELLEQLDRQLRTDSSRTDGIQGIFAFQVTGRSGGSWWIEANNGSGSVHVGAPREPTVTIHLADDVLVRLGNNELTGAEAHAENLLTVEGDQSKAIFLGQIFGV